MPKKITQTERFFAKVLKLPSGCWLWMGAIQGKYYKNVNGGYGSFRFNKKVVAAHLASCSIHRKHIAKYERTSHTCGITSCVNPDHIEIYKPKKIKNITYDVISEYIEYNEITGEFFLKKTSGDRAKKGDKIGYKINQSGYLFISFLGSSMQAHRLAFLYMTGKIPEEVDHINHIRDDNRWCNLRASNRKENSQNISMRKDNKSGFNGVCWDKRRSRWESFTKVNFKKVSLGFFVDKNDAIEARKAANIKYNFHPNHGSEKNV